MTATIKVLFACLLFACFLLALLSPQMVRAQEKTDAAVEDCAQPDKTVKLKLAPVAAKPEVAKPEAKPAQANEGDLARWFELQTATLSTRYRYIENSAGATTFNHMQHNEAFKGRFKFDAAGRYSVNAGLFTGNSFTGSWNNTGAGTGKPVTNLYLKQLYFSAKPVRGVELQYGGLYILRGESTEITSYDNDGFIMGERITLNRPKELFFDEVSVTYAHLGDLNNPDVTERLDRLDQSNYHQFLVSKKIGKRAVVSADYTFQSGVETLRQGVKLNTPELRVIDSLRFENYQRTDISPDYGFAVAGEKTLFKRLNLAGGYARIDPNYGGLNFDRFNTGKRIYVTGTYVISPEFSVSTFATRAVANDFALSNRNRFDLVFSYNLLKSLQRLGAFK